MGDKFGKDKVSKLCNILNTQSRNEIAWELDINGSEILENILNLLPFNTKIKKNRTSIKEESGTRGD